MLNNIAQDLGAPDIVNAIIEIPADSPPVKYEINKNTGSLHVDRFIATSMRYPYDYGYLPETLGEDGDPLDVLIISPMPLIAGAVIAVRPVGLLEMTDEAGHDTKIICVPISKLTTAFDHINEITDLDSMTLSKISHFFEHYKDLEKNKWVEINGWRNKQQALEEIKQGMIRAQQL